MEIAPSSEDQGQDSSSPLIVVVVVVVVILYFVGSLFSFILMFLFLNKNCLAWWFLSVVDFHDLEMDLGIPY